MTEENIADIGTKTLNGVRLQLFSSAACQWTLDGDGANTDDVYDVYGDRQRNPKAVDDDHVGKLIKAVVSSLCRWRVLQDD